MIEPHLEPRMYRIIHDANEHVYFVVWKPGLELPWTIVLGNTNMFMTRGYGFDHPGPDTVFFRTPQEALDFWKQYIADRAVAHGSNAG